MSHPSFPTHGAQDPVKITYRDLLETIIFNLQTAHPQGLEPENERDYLHYLTQKTFYQKFPWIDCPDNYVAMRGYTSGSMGELFTLCSDPEPPFDDWHMYHRMPDSFTPSTSRFEEHSLIANLYKMAKQHQETKCCPVDMVPYPEPIDIHIVPDDDVAITENLSCLTVNDPTDMTKVKSKSLGELDEIETLEYSDGGAVRAGLECLHAIRNGPANKIGTDEYICITLVRTAEGVEQPEKCSINPPRFIPYNGLADLRTQPQGSPEYLSQWERYNRSPEAWPVVMRDKIGLLDLSNHHRLVFDPEETRPFPAIVRNPMGSYQFVFCPNWGFQIPDQIDGQDKEWLFHRWLSRLPETAQPQDIYHHAFFDGTASADGGCGFMIQGIHHLETPRDMSDGQTRRHWHETAAGYATDMIMMKKLWFIQRDSDRYDGIMDEFVEAYDRIVHEFAQDS